ncbi:MAG TPA: APC family permease [Conexibacter sp.]
MVSTAAPEVGEGRLARGSLSAPHIVFMVIAAAAPMAVIVAIVPIAFALGDGPGTPGMFLLAAVTLALFSVGYTRAIPYVRNAGAFYAYVTRGLGRPAGLVAAYTAMVCYTALAAATCGALAFFAADTANRLLGIDLSWTVWAAIAIAVAGVLGYRRITMTARVLGVALLCEVLALLVLDIAILVDQGPSAFSLSVFAPHNVFGGVVGVAVIYAFSSFLGFEGTAIYAEEAAEPHRTVPRATYAAVAVVGIFYVGTTWALLAGTGVDKAAGIAARDPGNFVFSLSDRYIGGASTDVLNVLIVTSSFAAVLAFHNAASRYFYALARDGFLPAALARTHPRHHSPHIAGLTQIATLALIVAGFAIAGLDPLTNLSTAMTGFGAVGLMALLALTSLAVLAFFWRRGERGWAVTVAPALAAAGIAAATVLALVNYPSLTGSTSAVINKLPWLHLITIAAGIGVALWMRAKRPDAYRAMGTTRVDG